MRAMMYSTTVMNDEGKVIDQEDDITREDAEETFHRMIRKYGTMEGVTVDIMNLSTKVIESYHSNLEKS